LIAHNQMINFKNIILQIIKREKRRRENKKKKVKRSMKNLLKTFITKFYLTLLREDFS